MRRPCLAPLTPLYAAGLALRNLCIDNGLARVQRLSWPVLSIGNLSTGGAGKTPLTIALARLLVANGFHVDVLSRGYGRKGGLPARVLPSGTAEEFGDEPLLMARQVNVPVYVAADRYKAGLLGEAEASNSRGESQRPFAHILDDGFQHRQLARDVAILMLNRADWQDSLLPAGNLREPLRAALRASVIAIPADDLELEAELRAWGWQDPVWRLNRCMEVPSVDGPVTAFCGIARPEQFFAGLEAGGLRLATRTAFADHHRYADADVRRLMSAAHAAGAKALITTEKDHVRLGGRAKAFSQEIPLLTARLRIEIVDEDAVVHYLSSRLHAAPIHPPL